MLIFLLAMLVGAMVLQEYANSHVKENGWKCSVIVKGDRQHANEKSKSCSRGFFRI
jgi:hypothetical protein